MKLLRKKVTRWLGEGRLAKAGGPGKDPSWLCAELLSHKGKQKTIWNNDRRKMTIIQVEYWFFP